MNKKRIALVAVLSAALVLVSGLSLLVSASSPETETATYATQGNPLKILYPLAELLTVTNAPVSFENSSGLVTLSSDYEMTVTATAYVDQSLPSSSSETGGNNDDSSFEIPDSSGSVPNSSEADERPFMTTPIDDYNVTEGLLLIVVIIIILSLIIGIFRRR